MRLFSRAKKNIQGMIAASAAQQNLTRAINNRFQGQPERLGVPSRSFSSYPQAEQQFLANKNTNAVAGLMQPKDFIKAANAATQSRNLNEKLRAIELIKQEAREQLTPQELSRIKFPWQDAAVKKIHQRLINQEAGAFENIPNLFRRR